MRVIQQQSRRARVFSHTSQNLFKSGSSLHTQIIRFVQLKWSYSPVSPWLYPPHTHQGLGLQRSSVNTQCSNFLPFMFPCSYCCHNNCVQMQPGPFPVSDFSLCFIQLSEQSVLFRYLLQEQSGRMKDENEVMVFIFTE